MRKNFRLIRSFVKTAVAAQAGFRGDFFLGIFVSTMWLLAYVTLISTVFYNSSSVGGWSRAEVLIIFGLFEVLGGVIEMFIWSNIENFSQLVRDGSMDYIVTKPVDSQFHVVFRRFNLNAIGVLGAGVVALWYGFGHIVYRPDVLHIGATLVLLLCAGTLYYSIAILVETMAFWFIRLDNISVLLDVTYVVARYPLNIFTGVMHKIVFYIIPLAFFATVPTLVLLDKVPILPWLSAGTVLATIFFILSRLFWFQGLKAYSSASS